MTLYDRSSRRIASHYVFTPRGLLPRGIVSLDSSGRIVDVWQSDRIDSLEGVEFYSGILLPGLVNAHCHLELSHLRGEIEQGGGFAGFAAGLGVVRDKFSDLQRLQAAQLLDARLWSEGVQAVGDVCNGASTFGIKARSTIKYHNFLELYGLGVDSISPLQAVARQAVALGLTHSFTPHSTYSLNRAGFRSAVESGGLLSIHFMESQQELQLFEGHGDMAKWYDSRGFRTDFLDYSSPTARIIDAVPADRHIMLIHNTFVTAEDVQRLSAHFGDNLTMVLCPRSNLYINRALPPAAMLQKMGVRIAIGTDSLASNSELSMVAEFRATPEIPLTTQLGWATQSGAQALGLDSELGSIEVGKRPGLALLTGIDWPTMSLTEESKITRIY